MLELKAGGSVEAEFYGAVKGASIGLGMNGLYRDIGYAMPLVSESELSPGGMAEMRVLHQLMSSLEINDFFPMVKLDEGENQWANELEQGITRPSEELAGRLDFVPAVSEAGALMTNKNNFNNARDGIFYAIGYDDCDAVTKDGDEHVIDSYTNVIGDSDYDSFNRDYDKDTTDSFSSVIDAYIQNDVTESDDCTDDPHSENCRCHRE